MTDAVANPPSVGRTRMNTQHLAWGVLLLAFALFCVTCLVTGVGIHYFLFKSTVSMRTNLVAGRGTPIVINPDLSERSVRGGESRDLDSRSVVSTDSVGQATLSFYDQQQEDRRLVATAVMGSDTQVNLQEMSRPRFDWSTAGYEIHFDEFSGRLDITIPNGGGRKVQINIESTQGAVVRLSESGRYVITANDGQVRVETFSGTAELIVGQFERTVSSGERAMYDLNADNITLLTPYVRVLGASVFDETTVFATNSETLASTWICSNSANDNVMGTYNLADEDGQSVMHFNRVGSVAHGETFCHTSEGSGIDVSGYRYLSIEVTFKINSHSLSGCGEAGSECPLMLQLEYLPVVGQEARLWNHGFYLWNSQPSYPARCETCPYVNELVNPGVWYRYRSDNLFVNLIQNARPERIVALRVYASGHEYDVYVSEVSLFASEQIDPIPVGDPSLQG